MSSLPSEKLLAQQAAWLAPARARLLRKANIAHRQSVLDLACGTGAVTEELLRRADGQVIALDISQQALQNPHDTKNFIGVRRVCGRAEELPFADRSFDLVFCQFALLWLDAPRALREIHRVLTPGGMLAAIEPDYGGLIEHPPEIVTRDLWLSALTRAGGDPLIGRKLPGLLVELGFDVQVDLLDRLMEPSPARFDFLAELPKNDAEKALFSQRLKAAEKLPFQVAHLPLFLITAEVPA